MDVRRYGTRHDDLRSCKVGYRDADTAARRRDAQDVCGVVERRSDAYGLGWVIDRRGGKDFIWSNGASFGFRAFNALLPEEHVGVIVFSNADGSRNVTLPEEFGARVLDLIVPPRSTRMDNAIVERARDWLGRLTTGQIERGELTASFSAYLTDDLVAHDNFGRLGPLISIVPLSSTSEANGDTLYEFLVRFRRGQYHYDFELSPDNKIDGLRLTA